MPDPQPSLLAYVLPMPVTHKTFETPQIMTALQKRFAMLLLVTTFLAVVCIGCNTAHGFGRDMEKTGEKIQDGTK